jgi:bifunctional UDP-N-acetylglucosamine pyrophosphorylase / glucosamine-1-phosphate N-acetyltransferase
MNENITVIILAAGLGTRMKSAKAKVLHEAGGDTLLNQVIRAAARVAPAAKIIAVVGHQAVQVTASVKLDGIQFAEQREQKGTGHAVMCAAEKVASKDDLLLILNGDGPLLRSETLVALVKLSAGQPGGALVTTHVGDPTGYGRIVRDENGLIGAIVEQKAANPEQLQISEINPGVYAFSGKPFWQYLSELTTDNPAKEYYLTDMVSILRKHGYPIAPLLVKDETELLGINTRVELAVADRILRARKAEALMLAGVTIERPESVAIDADVEVGNDSLIEANVQLRGTTTIGRNCVIATGSILRNCKVEDNVVVYPYVVAEDSKIASKATVGPFARLRMNAEAGEDTRIGNFVELKKTKLGAKSKAQHLAYLGDATIGLDVNIGAGTITCNYDGHAKHQTKIADGGFIGSNSTLVAPLEIGAGAYVGAGSVITKTVDSDSLALGRAHQVVKQGWAKRRRTQRAAENTVTTSQAETPSSGGKGSE